MVSGGRHLKAVCVSRGAELDDIRGWNDHPGLRKLLGSREECIRKLQDFVTSAQSAVMEAFLSVPKATFIEASRAFSGAEAIEGMMYRLRVKPSVNQIRSTAEYPGEILIGHVRGTEEWFIFLNREKDTWRAGLRYREDKIFRMLTSCNMIDVSLHNHLGGETRWPSIADLGNACYNNASLFLIRPDGLEQYSIDELSTPSGGLVWFGVRGLCTELLRQPEVRVDLNKAILTRGGESKVPEAHFREFYDMVKFKTQFIDWSHVSKETLRPKVPGIIQLLNSPIPNVRLRALSQVTMFAEPCVPREIELGILGWAMLDPDKRVRKLVAKELANAAVYEND